MQTIKKVSNFCNGFTFYTQYNFEIVIDLNQVRDCIFHVLSSCDPYNENLQIRVLDASDDLSLTVIDINVEFLVKKKFGSLLLTTALP